MFPKPTTRAKLKTLISSVLRADAAYARIARQIERGTDQYDLDGLGTAAHRLVPVMDTAAVIMEIVEASKGFERALGHFGLDSATWAPNVRAHVADPEALEREATRRFSDVYVYRAEDFY